MGEVEVRGKILMNLLGPNDLALGATALEHFLIWHFKGHFMIPHLIGISSYKLPWLQGFPSAWLFFELNLTLSTHTEYFPSLKVKPIH